MEAAQASSQFATSDGVAARGALPQEGQEVPHWELYKENAAPLERGRNVAKLSKVLSSSPTFDSASASASTKKNKDLDPNVRSFEMSVRPSEKFSKYYSKLESKHQTGDVNEEFNADVDALLTKFKVDKDPIIHWVKYIKYFEESYPSDTHSQFQLMERCTHALFNIPRYKNDVRYVRVCVLYADKTSSPQEQFKFFHKYKVGEKVSIFWLAWAWVAEKQKDFPFADKIFRKAISKQAKPIKVVEQRYKQFQRRMSRYWLNNAARQQEEEQFVDEEGEEEYDENGENRRGVLNGLTEEGVRQNHRARGVNGNHNATGGILRTRNGQSNNNNNNRGKNNGVGNTSKTSFTIFMENDGQDNDAGGGYDLNQSTIYENEQNLLPRMVREKDRKKENTLSAEPWNERGGLHSHHRYGSGGGSDEEQEPVSSVARRWAGTGSDSIVAGGTSSQPAFQVFVDEDCAQEDEVENSVPLTSGARMKRPASRGRMNERTLRQRMDDSLKPREPLRIMRSSSDESSEKSKADLKHHSSRRAGSSTGSRKNEGHISKSKSKHRRRGLDESAPLSKRDNQREMSCFEEKRAKLQYFKLLPPQNNFNLLHLKEKEVYVDDDGSCTDMDDLSSIEEVDMEEEEQHFPILNDENMLPPNQTNCLLNTTAFHEKKTALNVSALHSTICDSVAKKSNPRKVLFDVNNSSFGNKSIISAANNTSTASSVMNEHDAVGLHGDKEETVNTKFAARELSMMFSSPALGSTSKSHNLQSSKMVTSNKLLFSVHRNKQCSEESHDSSDVGLNDKSLDIYNVNGQNKSKEKNEIFKVFEDLSGEEVLKNALNRHEGLLEIYEDSDSEDSGIRSEDRGTGDTASLADIMELMNEAKKENNSDRSIAAGAKDGGDFQIYCDGDEGEEQDEKPSICYEVDDGTVLTEDYAAFGDISLIPYKEGDTITHDIGMKMKRMSISRK